MFEGHGAHLSPDILSFEDVPALRVRPLACQHYTPFNITQHARRKKWTHASKVGAQLGVKIVKLRACTILVDPFQSLVKDSRVNLNSRVASCGVTISLLVGGARRVRGACSGRTPPRSQKALSHMQRDLDSYMTVVSNSHYRSTLDAVYVYVVPWPEFPIVPSYPHYPTPPPRTGTSFRYPKDQPAAFTQVLKL